MFSEYQKELIVYLKKSNMKNFINYWKISDSLEKFNLIGYLLKFPFFVIHELSHIIVAFLSGKFFKVKEFKFFEIKDSNLTVYSLCLEVHGEVDFYLVLGSIMPNIVYFSILFATCFIAMFNQSLLSILVYVYVLYGGEVGRCSEEDLVVFRKYFRKKKFGYSK